MKSISFLCEVVTPMFLAGADVDEPEIRPPSIKGALRWWWRALNGNLSVQELWQKEGELFGNGGEKATRSKVNILVDNQKIQIKQNLPNNFRKTHPQKSSMNVDILKYLAYGSEIRKFIAPESTFTIKYIFNNSIKEDDIKSVIKAFYFLESYGGLGSKSRNGFGCFKIIEAPENFKKDLSISNEKINNFESFVKNQSYLFKTDQNIPFNSWGEALAKIGGAYFLTRTNPDFEKKHCGNKRKYIALPLRINGTPGINIQNMRHSKPYFIHITKLETGKYSGHILFLPSKYCTEKEYMHDSFLHEKFDERYKEIYTAFNTILSNYLKNKKTL